MAAVDHESDIDVTHQSIPAVSIPPPGISGAFFHVVRPEGWVLVFPGALDALVFFHVTVLSLPFCGKFIGQG